MTHIPSGSMCMACQHRDRDCSHLAFESMPVTWRDGDTAKVRCTEFRRPEPRNKPKAYPVDYRSARDAADIRSKGGFK